jgi:hypothetical protein
MKTQAQAKKRNLRRDVLDWLRRLVRTLRKKFSVKGKSFEPFPNEAPH